MMTHTGREAAAFDGSTHLSDTKNLADIEYVVCGVTMKRRFRTFVSLKTLFCALVMCASSVPSLIMAAPAEAAASTGGDVVRVGAAVADQLDNWVLASTFGGAVPARMQGGKAQSEHAAFEVAAAIGNAPAALPLTEIRGEMQIRGKPQSLGLRMLRRMSHVLVREAGA